MSLFTSEAEGALGIRDLYRRVSLAIARGLRQQVWVRGEVSALREKNRWCFVTLAEPARDTTEADATLDVVIWKAPWARIARQLAERDLSLREGMTVALLGQVVLRPGTGRVQFECSALDTDALLGELTARRLALRRTLAAEGLLDANRRRSLAPVALRVGLVASPDSQGYQDFHNVLAASGYAFVLEERPVVVQGLGAPAEVAAALADLGSRGVDVVVVVRGGGARADLDAFDSELVVRAVAEVPVPVWTGLGHTGDRCLADDAASASYSTPTACAQALVSRVAEFERAVGERARRIQELTMRSQASAHDRLAGRRRLLARSAAAQLDRHGDGTSRRASALRVTGGRCVSGAAVAVTASALRLTRDAGAALDEHAARVQRQASTASGATGRHLERGEERLRTAAGRLGAASRRTVAGAEREVAGSRRVLGAFDPARQLERGWSLTMDDRGNLVRRASALRPGQRITSRFVDGERASVVEADASAVGGADT
ncbi:MAG: exodeoxyribonuclease VII large subunit [Acidimicrobiales bacterium]